MDTKKMKAWLRLIVVVLLLIVAFLVIFKNWGNYANLWFFQNYQVPVIWLIVITGLVAVFGTWVAKGVYRAYTEVKRPQQK